MAPDEVPLQAESHRWVVRVGDTVRRPVQPWTPAIHALLAHLEAIGFSPAPRALGIDDQGREILTYIPGESGPDGWAKVVTGTGLSAFAALLRDYHDAIADYTPAAGTVWATGAGSPSPGEVICHGDFGPWNVVWQDEKPVGIIDWDFAHPAPRRHDIAYALEFVTPFRDDAEAHTAMSHTHPPDRRRRLERFCRSYGLTSTEGMVDAVITAQRNTAELVRALAADGHEPQATWASQGYVRELEQRIEWTRRHRHLFA